MAIGLRSASFTPLLMYELDLVVCRTLRRSLTGEAPTLRGTVKEEDVTEVVWRDLGDRVRLAACEQARRNGCLVIVSNADHGELRDLYAEFEYHQLGRFCSISGSAGGRKHVTEALFVGKPT